MHRKAEKSHFLRIKTLIKLPPTPEIVWLMYIAKIINEQMSFLLE